MVLARRLHTVLALSARGYSVSVSVMWEHQCTVKIVTDIIYKYDKKKEKSHHRILKYNKNFRYNAIYPD